MPKLTNKIMKYKKTKTKKNKKKKKSKIGGSNFNVYMKNNAYKIFNKLGYNINDDLLKICEKLPSKLYDLVNNKKVMIVCHGPNLKNLDLGKYIDSFDVVCRLNFGYRGTIEYPKDLGKKCDILFASVSSTMIPQLILDTLENNNIKHLIDNTKLILSAWSCDKLENPSDTSFKIFQEYIDKDIIRFNTKETWENHIKKYNIHNEFHCISEPFPPHVISRILNIDTSKPLDGSLPKQPTTGLIAMLYILFCNPKFLQLVGFSWYSGDTNSGNYMINTDKLTKNILKSKSNYGKIDKKTKGHMDKKEPLFIKSIINELSNVDCDEKMMNILNNPNSWFNN